MRQISISNNPGVTKSSPGRPNCAPQQSLSGSYASDGWYPRQRLTSLMATGNDACSTHSPCRRKTNLSQESGQQPNCHAPPARRQVPTQQTGAKVAPFLEGPAHRLGGINLGLGAAASVSHLRFSRRTF